MKNTSRTRSPDRARNMKVSFASVVTESICTGSAARTWHTSADNDRFLQDAAARAQTVQRSMRYASDKERTYNSATGLTSPAILPQYLASPAEVVGIEHLLAAPRDVRASLRQHHARALMDEQQRQGREGGDPEVLAERLGDRSRIAAHMARERAGYCLLID